MAMESLLRHASEVYAVVYFGSIVLVSGLESAIPHRAPAHSMRLRWFSNFGITVLNSFLLRLLFPLLGVGLAALAQERRWGALNQVAWPFWLNLIITLVALDIVFYFQHRLLHQIEWLWRIHRTHHSDQDFDFSTTARLHPLEALYATTIQLAAIVLLGLPPLAVFIYQLMSTASGFIGHGNVSIPPSWDRALRYVVVTPDMHRIHHSVDAREGQSNLSNIFPWWDQLFGTYVDQPAKGQLIAVGIHGFENRKHLTLPWMLAQPFLTSQPASSGAAEQIET